MTFREDFTQQLRDHGQLPFESIKESMEMKKEKELVKEENK